jgi:hypothetical protein
MYFAFTTLAQCLTEGIEVLSKLMFVSCFRLWAPAGRWA